MKEIPKTYFTNDKDLIAAINNDNENALNYIYKFHTETIKKFVLKNSGSDDDAKDIVQKAVLVFWEKAKTPGFSLTAKLTTYMYSIARNLWLKELKKKGKLGPVIDVVDEVINIPYESDYEEKEILITKMMLKLSELGENCQKILTYVYWNNYKHEKIAQEMGYTDADNVKQQKSKCMKQLRAKCRSLFT